MAFKRSGVRLPLAPPAFAPQEGGSGWQSVPADTSLTGEKLGSEGWCALARGAKADRQRVSIDSKVLNIPNIPNVSPIRGVRWQLAATCSN